MSASPRCFLPEGLAVRGQRRPLADRIGGISAELLATGCDALEELSDQSILTAWTTTVASYMDPRSPPRRALDPDLCRAARLSPECLQASLAALLEGFTEAPVTRLLERARHFCRATPTLVVLASTVPGLALQPLLTSLALRQPMLFKSSSRESFFTCAFLSTLAAHEPAIGQGFAALAWKGGDEEIERKAFEKWPTVLCYGGAESQQSLARRVGSRFLGFGPKASLAVISDLDNGSLEEIADALARDIALFDQRGCLSLQAVFTDQRAHDLAAAIARALDRAARRWPSCASDRELAGIRLFRSECELRGLLVQPLELSSGTVVVEPNVRFQPSPGLRTIRIHALADLDRLPAILEPQKGWLQGACLSGTRAESLRSELAGLGFSRITEPGSLQSPPADWCNQGVDLMTVLGAPAPYRSAKGGKPGKVFSTRPSVTRNDRGRVR